MGSIVLIVGKEENLWHDLENRLKDQPIKFIQVSNIVDAASVFNENKEGISLVINDLDLGLDDGLLLFNRIRQKNLISRFIMINGPREKRDEIVETYDIDFVINKPFGIDKIVESVLHALKNYSRNNTHHEEIQALKKRVNRIEGKFEDLFWFVSKAKSMEVVNEKIALLRKESMKGNTNDLHLLLLGEQGTGKEGIARMIHLGSRRARGPWICINAAIIESSDSRSDFINLEIPGASNVHSKIENLIQLATDGTLFIDNIDQLDLPSQEILYQACTDRNCKFHLIATSQYNVEALLSKEKFLKSLGTLLQGHTLRVPALRERKEDILILANNFARKCFRSCGRIFPGFTSSASDIILNYSWPGNMHELYYVLARLALSWTHDGKVQAYGLPLMNVDENNILGDDQQLRILQQKVLSQSNSSLSYSEFKKEWTQVFEKEYLDMILKRNEGNVSVAARSVKLDRSNFLRLLRKYGIRSSSYKKAA